MPVPFTFANATNPIPLERLDANFTFLDNKVPVRAETADLVLLASQPNITSLGTLNNLNVTGTVTAGAMAANQIFGVLATPSQPNITQLGALDSLSVTNLITTAAITATTITGQLQTAAQPNITSLGTLTNLTVTGAVSAATMTGILLTAAQPNITSLGTLTALAVTGNVSGGNLSGTTISGTVTTADQPNITSVGTLTALSVTGNVSGGNLNTAGAVVGTSIAGNGRALTSLSASNIDTGTLDSARLSGTYSINVTGSASTAGTVTTAAQPTITSVGTLVSLGVTGNIDAGNVNTASVTATNTVSASGNISGSNINASGLITAANFSGSAAGLTGLNMNNATTGTLAVARGGTGTATATGSGSVVLSNSPSLVTPALGTPSSGTLTNATGLPIVNGTTGTLSVARGGTGATSAADARTSLDVPSRTGSGASGTWNISVVGPVENAQFAGFLVERYQFPTSTLNQTTWTYDFSIGNRNATLCRPGAEGFYLRAQPLDFFVFTGLPTFQTWSVTKLAYINASANTSFLRYTVTSNPGDFWPNTYVFWLYRIVNPIID